MKLTRQNLLAGYSNKPLFERTVDDTVLTLIDVFNFSSFTGNIFQYKRPCVV